ncbi:MAG: leucine-rich repeat domain-containing protein [Treponema sp.]
MDYDDKLIEINDTGVISCDPKATNIVIPNGIKSIKAHAFSRCEKLKKVVLPESLVNIHYNAFGSSGITEIIIPKNVKFIAERAFQFCRNLKKVTFLGDVLSIKDYAFAWCTGLEEINLPDSLKTIHAGVFDGCNSLKSIKIPANVKSILSHAFSGCKSLEYVEINSNVKVIDEGAFADCNFLEKIIYNGTAQEWMNINTSKAFKATDGCRARLLIQCTDKKIDKELTLSKEYYKYHSDLNSTTAVEYEKNSVMQRLCAGLERMSNAMEKQIVKQQRAIDREMRRRGL